MWLETPVFQEDMQYVCDSECIDWEKLRGSTVLISGGTGLIGYTMISALLYANQCRKLDLRIIALVRNLERAKAQFAAQLSHSDALSFVVGTVEQIPQLESQVDYIIHGACPTSSTFMVEHPVATIKASVLGTLNLLDLAKEKQVKGFVYLSSMEAYGKIESEERLTEDHLGYINPTVVRSCYPESKRMCEGICASYAKEFGIRAQSVRLAQTFGPGVAYEDKRVFALMARCAMNGEDIVLQTKGASRHPYLYTAQAVSAILCVLLCGEAGQVYNAANPETYCSVWEMGEQVAAELGEGKIEIRVAENGDHSKYPSPSNLNLDIGAISSLGWKPQGTLMDMYRRMMCVMK